MVTCNDEALYKRFRLLRSHGMTTTSYQRAGGHSTRYDVVSLGYNFRMDDLRAALGIVQLGKLRGDLAKRAQVRRWYEAALTNVSQVIVPFLGNQEFVSNYIFPVMLKDQDAVYRDSVRDKLHASGVQTSVHYPAVHRFSIYQTCSAKLPLTEYASDHLITLPMYSKLTEADVEQVVDSLKRAVSVL